MAEVLARFAEPVVGPDGTAYRAQAVGAPMDDRNWEGWIEFIPLGGGSPLRSPRETTQPNPRDAVYWATGLTPVYLEGALNRALHTLVRHVPAAPAPLFDEPAPAIVDMVDVPVADAVLDPFSVYEKGEELLRSQLGALEAWHLVNIVLAYRLSDQSAAALNQLTPSTLIEMIVAAVRERSRIRS
jgi:hypothetical protein